jgi:hypothetical protein
MNSTDIQRFSTYLHSNFKLKNVLITIWKLICFTVFSDNSYMYLILNSPVFFKHSLHEAPNSILLTLTHRKCILQNLQFVIITIFNPTVHRFLFLNFNFKWNCLTCFVLCFSPDIIILSNNYENIQRKIYGLAACLLSTLAYNTVVVIELYMFYLSDTDVLQSNNVSNTKTKNLTLLIISK